MKIFDDCEIDQIRKNGLSKKDVLKIYNSMSDNGRLYFILNAWVNLSGREEQLLAPVGGRVPFEIDGDSTDIFVHLLRSKKEDKWYRKNGYNARKNK